MKISSLAKNLIGAQIWLLSVIIGIPCAAQLVYEGLTAYQRNELYAFLTIGRIGNMLLLIFCALCIVFLRKRPKLFTDELLEDFWNPEDP